MPCAVEVTRLSETHASLDLDGVPAVTLRRVANVPRTAASQLWPLTHHAHSYCFPWERAAATRARGVAEVWPAGMERIEGAIDSCR